MQVRQFTAAALLLVSAAGAFAQEIDARDQVSAQSFESTRTVASVRAEVRNLQARGALQTVGELSQSPVVASRATEAALRDGKSRAQVKAELASWRAAHAARVGELG